MKKSIPKCGKSERLQVLNQEKMDRISSLPDEILCHILSFLPIKCAVQTCILSSRWKHLWTSLPCLCFDDSLWFKDKRPGESTQDVLTRFANLVNKVLLFHSADINKFSVHCSEPNIYLTDLPPLKSWVSSAIVTCMLMSLLSCLIIFARAKHLKCSN